MSASLDYILTADTRLLETRTRTAMFEFQFESSDRLSVDVSDNYELLLEPFEIGPGIFLPMGGYGFADAGLSYAFGQQRSLSGTVSVRRGQFWSGDSTVVDIRQGRIEVTPQLSVEPSASLNWVDLPQGEFTTHLGRVRVTTPSVHACSSAGSSSTTQAPTSSVRTSGCVGSIRRAANCSLCTPRTAIRMS
jgi:hypothetical protein